MKIQQSLGVLNALEEQEKYRDQLEIDLRNDLYIFWDDVEKEIIANINNSSEILSNYLEKYHDLLLVYSHLAYKNGAEYTSNIASLIEKGLCQKLQGEQVKKFNEKYNIYM
ncbi:hypothetical protein [Methanobrevibacter filiformis]|uniref:Uncharacterized protein n=1 Tax=Methanobrevibacter filiformis TaxID=55758 RepID=A0A166FFP7_9EURY|nr:hypothetical protein [Methanobrevibacter filiformis]KZX17629.1 hypothetical protein MBFIL_00160 [Methanobrevibacter filiformis]